MKYDDLFHATASLDEPPVPADVLGRVTRAQAHRRRRLAVVGAPLIALAVVAAVLLPRPGSPSSVVVAAAPTTYVGIVGDHAVRVDAATGRQTSLGPATAVAAVKGTVLLAAATGDCGSSVRGAAVSFLAIGLIPAMALSPDRRTLAYVDTTPDPHDFGPGLKPCTTQSLVLRDLATGRERRWPGTTASISSLSWSTDGQLAFTVGICCTDSETVHVLDTTTGPIAIDLLPERSATSSPCRYRFPTWAGTRLLVQQQCADPQGNQTNTVETAYATPEVVLTLPDAPVYVSSDPTGEHLLVTEYGTPEAPGKIVSYDVRTGRSTPAGEGVGAATWTS